VLAYCVLLSLLLFNFVAQKLACNTCLAEQLIKCAASACGAACCCFDTWPFTVKCFPADVPYELTPEFLEDLFTKHRIDYIVHGDDPCLLPDGTDAYAHAKQMGRFKMVSTALSPAMHMLLLCLLSAVVLHQSPVCYSYAQGHSLHLAGHSSGMDIINKLIPDVFVHNASLLLCFVNFHFTGLSISHLHSCMCTKCHQLNCCSISN